MTHITTLYDCESDCLRLIEELTRKEGIDAVAITITVCGSNGEVYSRTTGNAPKEIHTQAIIELINGETKDVENNVSHCHH